MSALPSNATLDEARAWLRDRVDEGERCPCCTQRAQVYRRKITSASAWALVKLYRERGLDWGHLPTILGRKQADEAKMVHWGLIEQAPMTRDDGSNRAGWWRVTPLGEAFVLGDVAVPKYARIYDSRCLGLDDSETVTIEDALGERFRYDDLMAGV
jgi:hypothetical protein